MASNYWDSSQRRCWTFTKPQLEEMRRKLEETERMLISQYALPDRRLMNIYFSIQLSKLGKRMSIRQQALATAQVYMRRYYSRVEIRRTNPYLVLSTAFYLACKMEECPHHIRLVVAEARNFWPDVLTSDTSQLGECEFALIAELNSQLIIHHPYRSLSEIQTALQLTVDEMSLAWNIINDHYLTNLPLLHAPHVIAVTAAFLAVVIKPSTTGGTAGPPGNMHHQVQGALGSLGGNSTTGTLGSSTGGATNQGGPSPAASARVQKVLNWLAEGNVDIEAIVDCVQELISLYEVWDGYKESLCKEPIARFVKARGLEK